MWTPQASLWWPWTSGLWEATRFRWGQEHGAAMVRRGLSKRRPEAPPPLHCPVRPQQENSHLDWGRSPQKRDPPAPRSPVSWGFDYWRNRKNLERWRKTCSSPQNNTVCVLRQCSEKRSQKFSSQEGEETANMWSGECSLNLPCWSFPNMCVLHVITVLHILDLCSGCMLIIFQCTWWDGRGETRKNQKGVTGWASLQESFSKEGKMYCHCLTHTHVLSQISSVEIHGFNRGGRGGLEMGH